MALFPYQARIRFVNPDGTLAPEALRLIHELVARSGGALGADDVDLLVASAASGQGASSDALPFLLQMVEPAPMLPPILLQDTSEAQLFDTMVFADETEAAPLRAVTLAVSPAPVTMLAAGALAINGGAVSALALKRGATTIALAAGALLVPVSAGDTLTITYTSAPTVHFIPR